MTTEGSAWERRVAIALTSATVLVLQIALTRILSVIIWYHWAFFVISLAMLGVGVPGVWFALRPPTPEVLPQLLRFAAISLVLAVVGLIKATMLFVDTAVIFCMLCLLPPMLSLGGAVCVLLLEAPGPSVARMYAWDLLGATAGALSVIPLMTQVPTPELTAGLAAAPLAASVLLERRSWPRASAIALAIVALFIWGEPFKVRASKNYLELGDQTPLYESWSPTARVTIFAHPFGMQPTTPMGWGYGRIRPQDPAPVQYWLEQDGSAGSPITQLVDSPTKLVHLLYDVTSVGYQLRPPKRAAIVGAGGGRDILTALAVGTESVDAIELNRATVNLLRGALRTFSGGVYDLPGVNTIVGEGRSAITHSGRTYDMIQISLIDSWAASAAGAYTLSEANLYTVDAYRLYLSRLSPEGMISTSRWMAGQLQLEIPRLLFVVHEALRQAGVANPRDHIALVQGGMLGTVLVSKQPFTPAEIQRLTEIALARGFELHLPVSTLPEGKRPYADAFDKGPQNFAPPGFDLRPPTDDKPFFFQTLSPFSPVTTKLAARYGKISEGVAVLRQLMIVMSGVTLVVFFAPFALTRRLIRRGPGFWRGSLYFTSIGMAFMLVEVAWVQRFILYLGHPSHAMTVALASLLLGAGIGSMTSIRVGLERAQRFGVALPLALGLANLLLTPVIQNTLGSPLALRVALAALLLAPAGFLMGFCFPLGMLRFGDESKAWFWALNGAAGVLASVGSLALCMELGFANVAFIGVAAYLAAWVLLFGTPPAASRSVTAPV